MRSRSFSRGSAGQPYLPKHPSGIRTFLVCANISRAQVVTEFGQCDVLDVSRGSDQDQNRQVIALKRVELRV